MTGDESKFADGHKHRSASGPAFLLQHDLEEQQKATGGELRRGEDAAVSLDAILDRNAFENPRCDGLEPQSDAERLCATARVLPGGAAVYRTRELVPSFIDCADEVIYRAAVKQQARMAGEAMKAGARLVYELREPLIGSPPALPSQCIALERAVEEEHRALVAGAGK